MSPEALQNTQKAYESEQDLEGMQKGCVSVCFISHLQDTTLHWLSNLEAFLKMVQNPNLAGGI